MNMNISILQFNLAYANKEQNIETVERIFKEKLTGDEDIVVLPETWNTAYSTEIFHNIDKFAETKDGHTVTKMKEWAKKYNIWLIGGSIPVKDGKKVYNKSLLINRNGEIVGEYDKMHLYSAMDENIAFNNGEKMPVFNTEFGDISTITCYDIRYPELIRTISLRGTKAIFVVANFPNPKLNHWRILLQARAIENQCYIVACNRVGSAGESSYFGHSMIISPWGEVVSEGDDKEGFVRGVINFEEVDKVRKIIPVYSDRVPKYYPDDILK